MGKKKHRSNKVHRYVRKQTADSVRLNKRVTAMGAIGNASLKNTAYKITPSMRSILLRPRNKKDSIEAQQFVNSLINTRNQYNDFYTRSVRKTKQINNLKNLLQEYDDYIPQDLLVDGLGDSGYRRKFNRKNFNKDAFLAKMREGKEKAKAKKEQDEANKQQQLPIAV